MNDLERATMRMPRAWLDDDVESPMIPASGRALGATGRLTRMNYIARIAFSRANRSADRFSKPQ
jgi:hypothetical protein